MDGFTLGTYAGKKLGYLEVSTEGIAEGDFGVLLLGDWIGSVVGLLIYFNKGTLLGAWYGKGLGTTLGGLFGITLDD